MTAPAFKAIGTRVSGNASSGITATSPVLAVGDICLAFVQAVNGNPATPSGWTLCAGCPTSTAAPFYNVYWQRASSAGTLSFSATQSGFVTAVIAAYSGCVTNGDPTEAGAGQQNDSSTTVNIPAITTLGADRLVVLSGYAGATPQSSIVNATLSGLATRESVEPQMGDGSLASAGSSGASSFTVGSAVPSAAHAIALIPTATSGNTAAASSSLGSLASSASATLAMAAAVSCGLGALSCGAAVTQSQAATAQPQLGALETSTSASQAQAATAASTLGALATAITVQQVNVNTATIVATLGPLSSGAVLTQSQAAAGASALSPLSASGNATQAQQAAAGSALPNFWCDASALASNQAQVEATLGPLFTAITATAQPTYIGDGRTGSAT